MAQVFPVSAQIIYDTLAADAVFMDALGEYTFKVSPGAPVPALSVVTPGQDLPSVESVSGVEVVIHDVGSVRRRDYLSSVSDFIVDWKVYLIAWEPANGVALTNAVIRMMQIFSGATSTEVVATADGIGAQVQTLVTIPADMPIYTA